jgi:hypothetical protein
MMNKILSALMKGMAFACVFFSIVAHAGNELNTINAEVESKAQQIDLNYGVLLDTQERNNLKIALIVKKVAANAATEKNKTIEQITDAAIITYEITDPVEQRKLLIEVSAQKGVFGTGNEPPNP